MFCFSHYTTDFSKRGHFRKFTGFLFHIRKTANFFDRIYLVKRHCTLKTECFSECKYIPRRSIAVAYPRGTKRRCEIQG
jgi:hypothetical protein